MIGQTINIDLSLQIYDVSTLTAIGLPSFLNIDETSRIISESQVTIPSDTGIHTIQLSSNHACESSIVKDIIIKINDPPSLILGFPDLEQTSDLISLDLSLHFSDLSDTLTYSVVELLGSTNYSVSFSGNLMTITPDAGYDYAFLFQITATDSFGESIFD